MLAMRLNAYVLNCLKCLWVKVGLFELEKLIKIRVLAYLRVANSKAFSQTNGYAMLVSKLGNLVYTCLLCAEHSNSRLINGIRTHKVFKNGYHG